MLGVAVRCGAVRCGTLRCGAVRWDGGGHLWGVMGTFVGTLEGAVGHTLRGGGGSGVGVRALGWSVDRSAGRPVDCRVKIIKFSPA